MREPLADLTERVATHVLERDVLAEDWEKGVAIQGLLATDQHVDEAQELVDLAIRTQTSNGQFAFGWGDYPKSWLDRTDFLSDYKPCFNQTVLGDCALRFYQRTGDERYLDAAEDHYEFLQTTPRTADGGMSHRRDSVELWVDALYFVVPFLARYGAITGDRAAMDEAATQLRIHTKHLQDPHTGLFRHNWRETPNSYPQGTFWARGVGWATTALVDALAILPDDHPQRDDLCSILDETVSTLVELQDASGFWHHILDDADTLRSPLETSGTLMFAYTIERGVQLRVLDDSLSDVAARALDAATWVVDERGAVRRVAKKPGGPGAPLGVTSFGQGWFLLAADLFS
ncbi:glycoside hydrolase family 88/105 protein [Salinirarus marinus]|uniref:glycoside hydrolase family 88/105 protein n=1 Tax=Salinirarus marinus TaxID=3068310 RepID=UPI003C6C2B6F